MEAIEPHRKEMVDLWLGWRPSERDIEVGYRGLIYNGWRDDDPRVYAYRTQPSFWWRSQSDVCEFARTTVVSNPPCTVEGLEFDLAPESLRQLIVQAAEQTLLFEDVCPEGLHGLEPDQCSVLLDPSGQWYEAPDDSKAPACILRLGIGNGRYIYFCRCSGWICLLGESAAPILASLFAFAGQYWSLSVPVLTPSNNVERKE